MINLEAFRTQACAWLATMVPEFGREARRGLGDDADLALGRRYMAAKYDAGFGGIHMPEAFGGRGLSGLHKIVFDTEEARHGFPTVYFGISLGMPIPIIMQFCEDKAWVRERVIAALRGEEIWCQLFSEPSGGSDLAGLRMKAEQDGNGWKLNGQKLWTSHAHQADYGIIVARSDPTVPKHKGLTYFWVDMHTQGVEAKPFPLLDGTIVCNEVFFDDVKLTDGQRIGPVGGGFGVAMATLMIERYVAGDADGFGPTIPFFVDFAREVQFHGRPAIEDGRIRSAIARNYALRNGLKSIRDRAFLMMEAGMEPGPEGSLSKLVSVRSRQKLCELAIDMQGGEGLAYDREAFGQEDWVASWLSGPTGRIAGGADEMLLNTIAERILGLPQDHRPDKGVPFNQIPA
jgi:alkylation response protein AidB-like acyl-CoA dehydrogenase